GQGRYAQGARAVPEAGADAAGQSRGALLLRGVAGHTRRSRERDARARRRHPRRPRLQHGVLRRLLAAVGAWPAPARARLPRALGPPASERQRGARAAQPRPRRIGYARAQAAAAAVRPRPALSAGTVSSGHALGTGAAGFIGSHLAERLLAEGVRVTGVDCFTEYYEAGLKRQNLEAALRHAAFTLLELDLARDDLARLPDVTVVFHQAAQPGVRASWGREFGSYVHHNVLATQRLLERYRGAMLERLVYASSSSVYGDAERYPTSEDALPRPVSPYGVTKL